MLKGTYEKKLFFFNPQTYFMCVLDKYILKNFVGALMSENIPITGWLKCAGYCDITVQPQSNSPLTTSSVTNRVRKSFNKTDSLQKGREQVELSR